MITTDAHGAGAATTRVALLEQYAELTKPGLTALSVCTAAGGAYLAGGPHASILPIIYTTLGTFLVGGGAGALNQYAERRYDALMKRTANRPLPGGYVAPQAALLLGVCLAASGVLLLAATTTPLAASLAAVTLLVYLAVYTPLKRISHFATAVGGVPGALPPVIGWVAVRGSLGIEAYAIFLLLYLWQMPHFLALAWMYRADYARGGFRLLPLYDPLGKTTSRLVVVYTASLIPATLLMGATGLMGPVFLLGGLLAGGAFLIPAAGFVRDTSNAAARRVFYASLIYLPVVLLLMVLDRALAP